MKILHLFLTLLLSINLLGQIEVPDPEFSGRPYYLKDGKLENLEKTEANLDVKVKALGYGGYDQFYSAFQPNSNVRFNADNIPHFYIKLEGGGDVSDKVSVGIGEIRKDRRRFKTASRTLGGKSREVNNVTVNISLKKVRENIYEIVFDAPLKSGEYAFMPVMDGNSLLSSGGNMHLYCFGINGSQSFKVTPDQTENATHKKPIESNSNMQSSGDQPNPVSIEKKTITTSNQNIKPKTNTTTNISATPVISASPSVDLTYSPYDELLKWKKLLDSHVITEQEYGIIKKRILPNL